MRVIVVGAGLGGLTLAHGLRRAGIDVAVYERDAARGRPQGISLHFDDRGTTALRGCLPAAHVEAVEATMGGFTEQAKFLSPVDGNLHVVGGRQLDGKTPRPRPGYQVNRPLLRAVLLAGLEDAVRFEAALESFEQRPDGVVEARFSDGSTDTADLLVGADGVGSAVRRAYLPRVKVVDIGVRMLLGATPLRAIADTGLPELLGENANAVKVDGKIRMALNVMRFGQSPPATWRKWLPGDPPETVAGAEDYLMWAVPTTKARLGSADSPADVWEVARRRAADTHPSLRLMLDEAWPEVTAPLRVGLIPPMRAWPTSRVTVLGDAIHVAPGIGGNLAMRDAHLLSDELACAERGAQSLDAAIGAYEDEMRRLSFPAPFSPRRLVMRHLVRFASPIAQRKLG